jgi:hypothetical protein
MAKRMNADEITDAVMALAETTRKETIREILAELSSGWKRESDPDTWQAGFDAAIAVIKNNFVS